MYVQPLIIYVPSPNIHVPPLCLDVGPLNMHVQASNIHGQPLIMYVSWRRRWAITTICPAIISPRHALRQFLPPSIRAGAGAHPPYPTTVQKAGATRCLSRGFRTAQLRNCGLTLLFSSGPCARNPIFRSSLFMPSTRCLSPRRGNAVFCKNVYLGSVTV